MRTSIIIIVQEACHLFKTHRLCDNHGEMNACIDLPFPATRPFEIGFRAAWERVQRFVDSAPPLAPLCLACNTRGYCPRCPAWSHLENGTLTDPVPYLCEIARARKAQYQTSEVSKTSEV